VSIINAGNVKCPYEPKNDVPKKQRVFFDEKGQALKGAPVPNMTMEGGEVHCKSYQKHPTPGLKTKGRGEITDKIGCIAPGLSLRFSIWDEAKERTIPDKATQDGLVPFAPIVVELDVKSYEQCEQGWGLVLRKVALVPNDVRLHAAGLFQAIRCCFLWRA
tara:strand:- start:1241 stop:1723 length:483 start_codon:yes stop_codon:yes gene_type:complete